MVLKQSTFVFELLDCLKEVLMFYTVLYFLFKIQILVYIINNK